MNVVGVKFSGSVTDLSRSGIYEDKVERVTVSVVGAEPYMPNMRTHKDLDFHIFSFAFPIRLTTAGRKNLPGSQTEQLGFQPSTV